MSAAQWHENNNEACRSDATPAQVTEAHVALAEIVLVSHESKTIEDVATLIADSEAQATAQLRLDRYCAVKGRHEAEAERDQLRAIGHAIQSELNESGAPGTTDDQVAGVRWLREEVERLKGDSAQIHADFTHHFRRATLAEREVSALNAEVERLKNAAGRCELWLKLEKARAERVIQLKMYFESELAKERARLDWLEANTGGLRAVNQPIADTGDFSGHWEVIELHMAKPRERVIGWGETVHAAIDAAMKEGGK